MKRDRKSYRAWQAMKNRCLNPRGQDYKYYGGRGITVDPAWMSYDAFLSDMGEPAPDMTLDRIDRDGPYSKSNCRWASRKTQARNRDYCKLYEFNGETLHTWEWLDRLGLTYAGFNYRLDRHRNNPARYPYETLFRPKDTVGAIKQPTIYAPKPEVLARAMAAKTMREQGAKFSEIAAQLSCTVAMVRRYVYWDGNGHISKFTRVP